ncbi:hypothetical protein A605_10235 [Corynebacterium halotolerans YIM 70093 = DSM 44683]|uniref:Integrase catalytic domain-containing protein n=1 Tax=Corynebacterium halotolerans YIM 70093 = DSM 44683 TaxID=1121362 RepID=M1NU91_9CORY|nr:hypothetical protein A605_10235 [Corynebacterium halotolerans YIM 70093 = DSM 44683]
MVLVFRVGGTAILGCEVSAPRITIDLHAEDIFVNKKTVAKAMRRLGIEGISPRSWVPVTTIPGRPTHSIPDRVKRLFDTGELNRVWMSDITYLRTGEGWLYLCAVCDGCSRRVLGWAMDSTQTTDLVERALRMAHMLRGEVPDGLVFHADYAEVCVKPRNCVLACAGTDR